MSPGPGRPAIGEPIPVRLGPLRADLDSIAQDEGRPVAAVIRDVIALGLPAYRRRKQRQEKERP